MSGILTERTENRPLCYPNRAHREPSPMLPYANMLILLFKKISLITNNMSVGVIL